MISMGEAFELLKAEGQEHVLRFMAGLDEVARRELLEQVEALDFGVLGRLRGMLAARDAGEAAGEDIEPDEVEIPDPATTAAALAEGERMLRAGEAGVVLVAGGQGSRLGYDGPKGCFPIGPVSRMPLFGVHARKILGLERRYGAHIPFYIMTSEANDQATRQFFAQNGCFGLDSGRVMFFTQGMWPALDDGGRIIMESKSRMFMSPDGHGGILCAMKRKGIFDDMRRRGVKTLFYFQVDNPMVAVADPVFMGLHSLKGADISLKVCAKRDAGEGLGVVVRRGGRSAVVEYTELTDGQKHATRPDGLLKFLYGSVAIHVFSIDFMESEASGRLPLHIAHKKVPYCDGNGVIIRPDAPNAFKFEQFIFDVLPDAGRVLNLAFKREDEFAPVKNAEGGDSPGTAEAAMTAKFARWLESCGVDIPRDAAGRVAVKIEIDPCYAGDAVELKERLQSGFMVRGDAFLHD